MPLFRKSKKTTASSARGPEGLTILWPPDYSPSKCRTHDLDIVAVHGLNGGSLSTWTLDQKLWLRDFLPKTFPSARIMTFGYNANLFKDCATGRIDDFANNLVAMLLAERQEEDEKRRPILFVCHSMGGLVVKRALTIATARRSDIWQSTTGLVFLATPHRGANAASLADMATKLMKVLKLGKPGTKSTAEVKEFSSAVQGIHSDFVDIGANYKILSFFELKGYPSVGLIVDEWSARMEVANETQKVGLATTHTDICHFSSDSDSNYKILVRQLEMFARQVFLDASMEDRASETTKQLAQNDLLFRYKSNSSKSAQSTASGDLAIQNSSLDTGQSNKTLAVRSHREHKRFKQSGSRDSTHTPSLVASPMTNRLPYFFEQGFRFRENELRIIDEHFSDEKYKIPAIGIYGEGGVGKSQIALSHIHRKNRTYKAIFWFHSDTVDKVTNDCDAITVQLGLQEKRSSMEEGRRLFNLWLQENKDWLLVFDNVEDMETIAPYWPTSIGTNGYIIVTSRNPQVARSPLTMSKEIESFSVEDGAKMLLAELSSTDPEEKKVALDISTKVGGLPLAIHHMACFTADKFLTLSETLKLYESQEQMVIGEGAYFGQDHTLATVWNLSISTLQSEALELLDTIGLFDPDFIPTQLIEHFSKPEAMAISPALGDFATHCIAMGNLHSRSLVRKKGSRTSPILSIHRLIQSAVRRRWTDDQKQTIFERASFCIIQVYPRQVKGQSMSAMYQECATYNAHLLSIERYYRANKDKLRPTMEFAEILAHCGWYYYERGQYSTSMDILNTAKDICLLLTNGKMDLTLGLVYNNMACVYAIRRERAEKIKYISLAISHREASLSPDDPEIQQLGVSYMNYANVLQSRSIMRIKEAEVYYKKALDIAENCPGGTPEGLELRLNSLGSFKFIAGDVEGALPYIERAIALRPVLKTDTSFTLHTLYVYGSIQWELGQHEKGYKTHLQCLDGYKKLEGDYHFSTGASYHKVGCLAQMMGKEIEAIENFRAALNTFRKADAAPGFLPRTCLVLGKILIERGSKLEDVEMVAEGTALKQEGSDLAFKITHRRVNMETEQDFDELVARSYR